MDCCLEIVCNLCIELYVSSHSFISVFNVVQVEIIYARVQKRTTKNWSWSVSSDEGNSIEMISGHCIIASKIITEMNRGQIWSDIRFNSVAANGYYDARLASRVLQSRPSLYSGIICFSHKLAETNDTNRFREIALEKQWGSWWLNYNIHS